MFIVNIPMVFGAVWRVAQCFVDERVKAKIRFLRKNELHMLHEFIDRKILPVSLGGENKEQMISTRAGELQGLRVLALGLGMIVVGVAGGAEGGRNVRVCGGGKRVGGEPWIRRVVVSR